MPGSQDVSGSQTLHRLIYSSRATDPADQPAQTPAIVALSIRNNRRDGITGLLLHHDGWFLQALEGPARAVQTTYGRILQDRRHGDARVLSAGPAERRLFGAWSMCARSLSDADEAILNVLARRALDFTSMSASEATQVLSAVRDVRTRLATA